MSKKNLKPAEPVASQPQAQDEPKRSAPLRLLDLVWGSTQNGVLSRSDGQPVWRLVYQAMQAALNLAIDTEMAFDVDDYGLVMEEFRGGAWGGPDRAEFDYERAVVRGNESFCLSFEKWCGRKPLRWKGERLAVGTRVHLLGIDCEVAGFVGADHVNFRYVAKISDAPFALPRAELERIEMERINAKRFEPLMVALGYRPLLFCGGAPPDPDDFDGRFLMVPVRHVQDGKPLPLREGDSALVFIRGPSWPSLEKTIADRPDLLVARSPRPAIVPGGMLEDLHAHFTLSAAALAPLGAFGLPPEVVVWHTERLPGLAEAVADVARFGRFGRLAVVTDRDEQMHELAKGDAPVVALRCFVLFGSSADHAEQLESLGGTPPIVLKASTRLPTPLAISEALLRAAGVALDRETEQRRLELCAARRVAEGEANPK